MYLFILYYCYNPQRPRTALDLDPVGKDVYTVIDYIV